MELKRNPMYLPEENTLKGVVTPLTQNISGQYGGVLSLSEILSDEKLSDKFIPGTFPRIEKTSSGWFFSPISRNIYNMHQSYSKWFSITRNGLIPNDHAYEYAKLNVEDGFLLKITIPMLSNHIIDFHPEYAESVKEIIPMQTGNENILLTMPVFDPRKFSTITNLLSDQETFIKKYLQDIQKLLESE